MGYAHVSRINPSSGASYTLGIGSLSNGTRIGWTEQWPYQAGCYEVTTAQGVHWHLEARQDSHFSCYISRSNNTAVGAGVTIGRMGSNATATKQAC